jgi:histidine ammonia-lyase
MVQAGWAEEARALAQPTLLSLAGFGQNDVPAGAFRAWRKAAAIGGCLDAALGGLAALGSQALHAAGRPAPPALAGLVDEVRAAFPPVAGPRRLGDDGAALAAAFSGKVLSGAWPAPGRSS